MTLSKEDLLRFQKFIELDLLTGCWIWKGSADSRGYGQFWIKNKLKRSHRVSYEYWNDKIPEGLVIDHLCRNILCVNPDHLETVTIKENIKRGLTGKINNRNAEKTHCPSNHEYIPESTYTDKDGRRQCKICRKLRKRLIRQFLS